MATAMKCVCGTQGDKMLAHTSGEGRGMVGRVRL
jgi:hypothetical protein